MCSHSPESQPHPGLHKKQHGQQVKGGDPVPLFHSHEERLRELGLFSMKEGRLWGQLLGTFKYIDGPYKKDGERLFTKKREACTK